MGLPKRGLLEPEAIDHVGAIEVAIEAYVGTALAAAGRGAGTVPASGTVEIAVELHALAIPPDFSTVIDMGAPDMGATVYCIFDDPGSTFDDGCLQGM